MRTDIQSLLDEITSIETGPEVADDVIEGYTTYFSFSLTENNLGGDTDKNYTYRVNLIGYVKRLVKSDENTLQIVDDAVEDIISKLKEFNIKYSYCVFLKSLLLLLCFLSSLFLLNSQYSILLNSLL